MNFFKYLLLMLAASEVTKSTTAAEPLNAIGNNDTELQPPVLFSPIPLARSLQDSKPLWGVIQAESIQHKINSDVIMKLIEISNPEVNLAYSSTAQDKISFFEKGAKYTPKQKTHQKNRNVKNRGLSDISEMAADIDQILLESPNGYAVLSIDPESKTIISGKIEERDDGTNSTTLYIIQGSNDPTDLSYKITIIDRAAQLARTDNPDEQIQHTQESHSRQLGSIPAVFTSGVPPKPGETRVFTMRIYYSDSAVSVAGGMQKAQAHAGQVVTDINFFLGNSGIKDWMQLKLQDVVLSPIAETGDSYTDLVKNAVSFDRGGADFVMYITNALSSCGRGYVYGTYYPTAESFQKYLTTVVKFSCSLLDKSAAHEFGHNLAGMHDIYSTGPMLYEGVEIFPYARALMDKYYSKGSILAYLNIKSDRYPFYSSASGVYNGIKMGSEKEDNVRAFKSMLQTAHSILHGGETAAPTIVQDIPSIAPTTAITKTPTAATKRPTVTTNRPTVATYKPTKRPTNTPTKKVSTSAPTIDQTPTINENFKVGFSFLIPKKSALSPLKFQVTGNRLITLSSTGIYIQNSKNKEIEARNIQSV